MSRLPIKVQVGIRDAWDNQDSPVQKAIKKFKEVVGVPVSVVPEWSLLITELGPFYPDKEILVLSVAAAVEACVIALTTLTDDEASSEWAESLLERTEGHVRLLTEASKNREIGILWSNEQRGLVISLPKSAIPSQSYMLSFFTGSLLKVFDEDEKHNTSSNIESTAADDWADVAVDNKTGNAAVIEILQRHTTTQRSSAFDLIPDVDIIPRPDELLLKPPYFLTPWPNTAILVRLLEEMGQNEGTVVLQPPLAEIKLHQSAFGLGVVYDRMTVTVESRYAAQEISPTIILGLVEGVLGYKIVSNDGPYWSFRRDVEFRNNHY